MLFLVTLAVLYVIVCVSVPPVCFSCPKSLSRESKRFANEWPFEHVASSLHHPIAWPRIRLNLLCKGTKNGSGPSIGLLNPRNVPKDQTLGSPARRLMSSRSSITIPVTNHLTLKAASTLNALQLMIISMSSMSSILLSLFTTACETSN